MKTVICFILGLSCLNVFALDISRPTPIYIYSDDAWKFGIEQSSKTIEGVLYISIAINPRLLCEVEKIESLGVQMGQLFKDLDVLSAAGAYTINFEIEKFEEVSFIINCKNESKVHRKSLFKYIAWGKPIA